MLNVLNASSEELLEFLREEQKICFIRNKEQIKNYFLKSNLNNCDKERKYKYEEEILFMIKNFISLKFICKYFNVSSGHVKEIAMKHKYSSYLLSDFTENANSRCFNRGQILKACEDFNYICPMCFKPLDITNLWTLTGHHIQPFARGGKTLKDNCLPLHINCHFDDFKLLHSSLFNAADPIYSAKYFNLLKERLQKEESGISFIIQKEKDKGNLTTYLK